MAKKKVIWTPTAIDSFNGIIDYLEASWTNREVERFVKMTDIVV